MAETLNLAAVIASGLTMVGVVLDWGVPPETKKSLQTKLEAKLYWFRYTTIRNFGREEIEFAMGVFDLLGRRFLSRRRLCLVGVVLVTSLVLSIGVSAITHAKPQLADPMSAPQTSVIIIISAVLFSLSISLSFWICRAVVSIPGGATLLGTSLLLLLHLVLFVAWRPFGQMMALSFANLFTVPHRLFPELHAMLGGLREYLEIQLENGFWGALFAIAETMYWDPIKQALAHPSADELAMGIETILAAFANALRVLLAFAFIIGFVYIRYLRIALIWFWSALIRSSALFSPPLSALAAIIVAIDKRDVIISAITRSFH